MSVNPVADVSSSSIKVLVSLKGRSAVVTCPEQKPYPWHNFYCGLSAGSTNEGYRTRYVAADGKVKKIKEYWVFGRDTYNVSYSPTARYRSEAGSYPTTVCL